MNSQLEQVCRRVTDRADNQMEVWQWDPGVALAGLWRAYEKQGARFCFDYIKDWTDKQLASGFPGKSINTTAPCLTVLELYKATGEQKYLDVCDAFADWCMAEAPRSERGTFEHSCTANVYPNQIWADTLFMGCLFLASYGRLTGRRMYIHEALRQYLLHYEFLKAEGSALIRHGYYGDRREQVGVIWGRGNGWLAVGSPMILSMTDESFPEYAGVRENFRRYAAGLIPHQNPDGSFNTVIDAPDSYPEMSATAAFAFALDEGIRTGLLDGAVYREPADKAYAALLKEIGPDGTVLNASGGTCIMPTAEEYNAIPLCYSPFAQGLAALALANRI